MRNLRKLGLALMAVMALGAVVASAAQATNGEFTAGEYPAVVSAEQETGAEIVNRFVVGGVGVECEVATFGGTLEKPSSTLGIHPHYTNCETSLGTEATIDVTNGCGYLFHAGEGLNANDDVFAGTVDIHCESEGKTVETATAIVVTAGFCNIDVKTQTGINGITYTNITGSPKDVTIDVNSTNVEVKGTNVFLCPSAVTSATTGTYESKVTVKGFEDIAEGKQIDALISTEE